MKTFDYKKAFGHFLRGRRLAENVSQEAFAYQLGINRTYYGKIERGENSVTLDKIEAIASYLNLSVSELFIQIEQTAE